MIIWVVSPKEYNHVRCFDAVARSFAEALGCDVTYDLPENAQNDVIVFAPHLLPYVDGIWPKKMILFNSEQLSTDWIAEHQRYWRILSSGCYRLWDYCKSNIDFLAKKGVGSRLCEIGWMPSMSRLPGARSLWFQKKKDYHYDVLFYGSRNERRVRILRALEGNCNLKVVFDVYGAVLDDLLDKSKIVLNLHFYETGIHEIFRTSYLMANRKFVVTERGRDAELEKKYEPGMWFCNYENLAMECLNLLKPKAEMIRDTVAQRGFEIFSKTRQSRYLDGLLW